MFRKKMNIGEIIRLRDSVKVKIAAEKSKV